MRSLEGIEPEKVFYYFEEISRIPRGSYHEKAVSDYLVGFAKERNSWRSKNVLSEFHASLKSQYTRNIVKDCDVSWLSIGMSVNLRYYVV